MRRREIQDCTSRIVKRNMKYEEFLARTGRTFRQVGSAPRTKTNGDDGTTAIMNDQAVATVGLSRNQAIRAVKAVAVLLHTYSAASRIWSQQCFMIESQSVLHQPQHGPMLCASLVPNSCVDSYWVP
jgi:hypothetical protein